MVKTIGSHLNLTVNLTLISLFDTKFRCFKVYYVQIKTSTIPRQLFRDCGFMSASGEKSVMKIIL